VSSLVAGSWFGVMSGAVRIVLTGVAPKAAAPACLTSIPLVTGTAPERSFFGNAGISGGRWFCLFGGFDEHVEGGA